MKHVKIGCYRYVMTQPASTEVGFHDANEYHSGFWGDSADAVTQFLETEEPRLHYVVADYLAGRVLVNKHRT